MSLTRGNLFLVGMMGAGKTTLGRQLARRLGKRFVDADHEMEARLGVPIPTIFEIEGEQGFREREEAIIVELTALTDIVLATGGGAITRPGSRASLHANGTVLYLHASPDTLWMRVRHARHRPMLHSPNPRGRLAELYRLRDPLYREVAHHVVESDREGVIRFVRTLATVMDESHDEPPTSCSRDPVGDSLASAASGTDAHRQPMPGAGDALASDAASQPVQETAASGAPRTDAAQAASRVAEADGESHVPADRSLVSGQAS